MTFRRSAAAKSRFIFLVAAALIAAALGDALVETISNSGVVGTGYRDNDHLSVIPTLIAGASLVLLLIWSRCAALLRHAAKEFTAHAPLDDLPFVLVLQFGALFVMESCEQFYFGGKLLGGNAWLGGPLWFSVGTHVLIGSFCALLIGYAMRAIVRRCAVLVGIAREFILDAFARENCAVFSGRRNRSRSRSERTLRVQETGERAPPLLHVLNATTFSEEHYARRFPGANSTRAERHGIRRYRQGRGGRSHDRHHHRKREREQRPDRERAHFDRCAVGHL